MLKKFMIIALLVSVFTQAHSQHIRSVSPTIVGDSLIICDDKLHSCVRLESPVSIWFTELKIDNTIKPVKLHIQTALGLSTYTINSDIYMESGSPTLDVDGGSFFTCNSKYGYTYWCLALNDKILIIKKK